jgi:hypothetical protein
MIQTSETLRRRSVDNRIFSGRRRNIDWWSIRIWRRMLWIWIWKQRLWTQKTKTSMNILLLMMDVRKVIEQGITHTYIDLGSYGDWLLRKSVNISRFIIDIGSIKQRVWGYN